MDVKFVHKVSKGSRFNQIYIPYEKEREFEPGDLVEVRLLEKSIKLYYSKNLKELGKFKENLIGEIFKFLASYKEIEQMFMFGSFLTKKIDYQDIDILVLTDEKNDYFENKIYADLINKFNLKFHLISFNGKKLKELLKICPLTRSMLYYYVSNKKFEISKEIKIDNNHICFLLMMPEDLLDTNLNKGLEYYNALRKLYVTGIFLLGKEIPPNEVDTLLEKEIGKAKLKLLKDDEILEESILKELKTIIRSKLRSIYKVINHGKKR